VGDDHEDDRRRDHGADREDPHDPACADAVRQPPGHRLDHEEHRQGGERHQRDVVLVEAADADQVALQVARVGVEHDASADGHAEGDREATRVLADDRGHAQPRARAPTRLDLGQLALVLEEVVGLVHPAAEVEDRQADHGAEGERHPPAPGAHGRLGEEVLQDDHRRQGQQLTEHDRDELEAGEEAAPARVGDLGEVRRAGAELATEREPLGDARRHRKRRLGIG